jgi:hypothetical protein
VPERTLQLAAVKVVELDILLALFMFHTDACFSRSSKNVSVTFSVLQGHMYIVQKHCQDDLIEEDGMGGVCSRIGDMRNTLKILV